MIDGSANFNEDDLNEFKWLATCLLRNKDYSFKNENIKIYKIKKNCIN